MKNYLFVMNSGKVPEPHGIKMKTARWNSVNMAACLRKYSHFVSLWLTVRNGLSSGRFRVRQRSGRGSGWEPPQAQVLFTHLISYTKCHFKIRIFSCGRFDSLPSWLNEPVHMPTCHPLFLNIIPCFCFYLFFNICHHGCNASVWLATD